MKELVEHRIALRAVANQRSDEAPATVFKEPLATQRDELGSHGKRIQIVMLEAFLHTRSNVGSASEHATIPTTTTTTTTTTTNEPY